MVEEMSQAAQPLCEASSPRTVLLSPPATGIGNQARYVPAVPYKDTVTSVDTNNRKYTAMSYETADGYKIKDQHTWHYPTFTVVDWIDLFTRKCYRDILIRNMEHCQKHTDLKIGAYVIMSNHLHLIWCPACGRLSVTIRDFKSYCTKQFIESILNEEESRREGPLRSFHFHAGQTAQNKEYKIGKSGNHPEEIHSKEFMLTKLQYTHENPVRAGWVQDPEDWLYSSAGAYAGKEGLLKIDFLY